MRNLPEVVLSFEPLTRILNGAVPAKLLLTAIELEVFSHLSAPMSAESLARELGTHPENTRIFLDALTANDLLQKAHNGYTNSALARAFLVNGSPTYLGDALLADAEWMHPALERLTALVKQGPSAGDRPHRSVSPAHEAEVYANCQREGVAQQAAALAGGLTGAYAMFDEGEIAQAMLRVGFRSVHSRVVEGSDPHGPAVVDIARK